uniref:Uncharacterized protein n=1 Tax=Chaetoceros debilis TaxID=122233 RepID=A0A7S3Q8W7_9STRA
MIQYSYLLHKKLLRTCIHYCHIHSFRRMVTWCTCNRRSLLVLVLFFSLGSSSAFLSSSSKAPPLYLPAPTSSIFTTATATATALSTTCTRTSTRIDTSSSTSNNSNSNISKNKKIKERSDMNTTMSPNGVIRISYQELKNQTPRAIAAAKEAFCNHNHRHSPHSSRRNNKVKNGDGNSNCCYGALAIYDIQVHQSDLNMHMNRGLNKTPSSSGATTKIHSNLILDWKSQREKMMNMGARLALDPSLPAKQDRIECKCDAGDGNENIRVGPGWSGTPGNEEHSLQSGFYANIKDVIKDEDEDEDKNMVGDQRRNGIEGIGGGKKGVEDEVRVWGDNRWPKNFKQSNKDGDNVSSASTSASESTSASVPQQYGPVEGQDFETCVSSAAAIMHHVTLSTLDLAQKAASEVMQEMSLTKQQNGSNIGEDGDDRVEATATENQSQRIEGCIPNLRDMAEQSNFLPARLVYYDAKFSREDTTITNSSEKNRDNSHEYKYWLPWHVDFNLATAFAPAMWIHEESALNGYGHATDDNSKYLETNDQSHSQSQSQYADEEHLQTDKRYYESSETNPEHHAGLLLRTSDGDIVPAALEDDCILVQLGAHAQLATGGILRAGPHAVGKFGERKDTHCAQSNAQSQKHTSRITHDGLQNCRVSSDQFTDDSYGRLSFGLFVYGPWSARMKASDELMNAMGIKGAGADNYHYEDEDEDKDDIVGDDFGGLMKKAYTGETVLEGYRKFEAYMNGK